MEGQGVESVGQEGHGEDRGQHAGGAGGEQDVAGSSSGVHPKIHAGRPQDRQNPLSASVPAKIRNIGLLHQPLQRCHSGGTIISKLEHFIGEWKCEKP